MVVRGLRYLWGSAGMTVDLSFAEPRILHVSNDQAGQAVMLGTRLAVGTMTPLGTLAPGECVSIEISDLAGIYAQCGTETLVHCRII